MMALRNVNKSLVSDARKVVIDKGKTKGLVRQAGLENVNPQYVRMITLRNVLRTIDKETGVENLPSLYSNKR